MNGHASKRLRAISRDASDPGSTPALRRALYQHVKAAYKSTPTRKRHALIQALTRDAELAQSMRQHVERKRDGKESDSAQVSA